MSAILELRRYQLHPGRRDDLIRLFDREFVESQEALGAEILGQFRDLDDPDQFVWLRGFADMPARAAALNAFYGGPVWQAHRAAANATMLDSSNALLLCPFSPECGFAAPAAPRPPVDVTAVDLTAVPASIIVATLYRLSRPAEAGFTEYFARRIAPTLAAADMSPIAAYRTLAVENNFPALPVRTDAPVFVTFARFADLAAYEAARARLEPMGAWDDWLVEPAITLRLSPTARSRLR
ncbi:NIPSNAP family containing protein [Aliidongia dinghuensis]|uniref:NIPSNAP family containing protein n=1 Tax=Aliidongia dinghuensis TaxID=1867774 RepID=A0A8J2YRL7_9PROT|nr:NIPSNAP family protein [Aliidongia dinghuensis]GGF10244.1 NIPSNAP family containing protein [Aliidongia dinghuensis]